MLICATGAVANVLPHVPLPPGFTTETLPINPYAFSQQKPFLVSLAFAQDGTLFTTTQGGVVIVYRNGAMQGVPFIDLTAEVSDDLDRGLLGIALHPGFQPNSATNWVYLLYNVSSVLGQDNPYADAPGNYCIGRLTRYRAITNGSGQIVAQASSRQILLGNMDGSGKLVEGAIANLHNSHGVGSLEFAADGSLLVSSGEGAEYNGADTGGRHPCPFNCQGIDGPYKNMPWENVGAFRAQEIRSLGGKVMRINPENGNGYASNPFAQLVSNDLTRNESRIWALGLRNPFRITIHPGTGSTDPADGRPGVIFIGDVGWSSWEELNISLNGGENFGWPIYEGNYNRPEYPDTVLPGMTYRGTYTGPHFTWPRSAPDAEPNGFVPDWIVGTCATGGVHYTGTRYPPEYQGAYFFGDYTIGWIRHLKTSYTGSTVTLTSVSSAFSQSSDFFEGPVSFGRDPISGDIHYSALGSIYRLRYGAPLAVIKTDRTYGSLSPLMVQFDGSESVASCSPVYLWDFGDGTTSSLAVPPVHSYHAPGPYTATLTVSCGPLNSVATVQIYPGNTPPVASIVQPPSDIWFFPQATMLQLQGAAEDAETTAGGLDYSWSVDMVHNTHIHPGAAHSAVGTTSTSFLADVTAHGAANDRYFYRVNFMAADPQGLSDTRTMFAYGEELSPNNCADTISLPEVSTMVKVAGQFNISPGTASTFPCASTSVSTLGSLWFSRLLSQGEYRITGSWTPKPGAAGIALYVGACNSLVPIYCGYTPASSTGPALQWSFNHYVATSDTVFIQAVGPSGTATGTENLSIQFERTGSAQTAAEDWQLLK